MPARGGRGKIQPRRVGTLGGTAFHASETFLKGNIPPQCRQEQNYCSVWSGTGFPRLIAAISAPSDAPFSCLEQCFSKHVESTRSPSQIAHIAFQSSVSAYRSLKYT